MPWVVLLLYVLVIAVIAAVAFLIVRLVGRGRLVHRRGVHAPKPKPLIEPLSQRALANLRARVAAQHQAAARAGTSVWGKTVTRARTRPRIPGRLSRTAVPKQTAPSDVPETAAAED